MSFPLNMRIGVIKEVKDHPNADKLYVLIVDLGDETRTLVAGLKKYYRKEEMLNRKIVVLCNLKPAVIRGVKSEGMLLAADDGNDVAMITTDAPTGARAYPEGENEASDKEITIEDFLKLQLEVRNGKVVLGDKPLKADGRELYPEKDVRDGARVR